MSRKHLGALQVGGILISAIVVDLLLSSVIAAGLSSLIAKSFTIEGVLFSMPLATYFLLFSRRSRRV